MANKNSGIKSSFAEGAGLSPRTAADPQASVRSGKKKCPPGQIFKNGRCVKYNPFKDGRTPTSASQTTGP